MARQSWRIILAVFLVLFGVIILLSNLNVIPLNVTSMQWVWLLLFGGVGIAFLAVFFGNKENWWAIIPALTLIGLAILVSEILPENSEAGGAIFLGMIGISFWIIYLQRREFWWAVIPAGALTTLAMVALGAEPLGGTAGGSIFFIGLALTFFAVYILPNPEGRMNWALWPAGILGIIGGLLTLGISGIGQFIFPAALIIFGLWIVYRSVNRNKSM